MDHLEKVGGVGTALRHSNHPSYQQCETYGS